MNKSKSITERALKMLKQAPRIDFEHIKDNPGSETTARQVRKRHNKGGKSHKELQNAAKPPLGWIFGDFFNPWQRKMPAERSYNKDIHLRREYPPLSLLELQRLIDLGWIDISRPIDLPVLCSTLRYQCDPRHQHFGVQLTDEGADTFDAQIDIEVQWASQLAISAVEKAGGRIRTAYYDPISLMAACDPQRFFATGQPISARAYPSVEAMKWYIDPKLRGYLAPETEVKKERLQLAQLYGYSINPENPIYNLPVKNERDVFHGLRAGWIVNLVENNILKPVDEQNIEFYESY